jgi:hypothetical protein
MSIRILGRHQSWEVVYRGSTDPCLYGRCHHQHHSINTAISIRPLCSFIRNSFCTDQSVLFQVFVCWPVRFGHVDRHRDPWEQWELHLSLSDTLWHCCWEPSALPSLGYIYSFGEDDNKDFYVVRPSLCSYTCPTERPETGNGAAPPGPSSKAPMTGLNNHMGMLLLSVIIYIYVLGLLVRPCLVGGRIWRRRIQ